MSVEPDKQPVAELEQPVADRESRLANDNTTPLIVPKAITFARGGLILSLIIILIGICALFSYSKRLQFEYTLRPRIATEDPFFLSVPVIIYPMLWTGLAILVLRGLQLGTRWGHCLAIARIWLALPLIPIDIVMMIWAMYMLYPQVGLVMVLTFVYVLAEVFFVVAGILSWRARAAARTAAAGL